MTLQTNATVYADNNSDTVFGLNSSGSSNMLFHKTKILQENERIHPFIASTAEKVEESYLEENPSISDDTPSSQFQSDCSMSVVSPDFSPGELALTACTDFMERIENGFNRIRDHGKKIHKLVWKNRKLETLKRPWKSIVHIVLVEAKDLSNVTGNSADDLYCKFKLGVESYKSGCVSNSNAMWCERFSLHLWDENRLEVTLWKKEKPKMFIGRCSINLTELVKDRTHELRPKIEYGAGDGVLHLVVTVSGSRNAEPVATEPLAIEVPQPFLTADKFTTTLGSRGWEKLKNEWLSISSDNDGGCVGTLQVGAVRARLAGRPCAYCVLELGNARLQTHVVSNTNEPNWEKSFVFDIKDITSTLDVYVYDNSILNAGKGEMLGELSIPLLRIKSGETKWFALKNRPARLIGKGNCPRILLEMSIDWSPLKASLRVLNPKEDKYIQKKQNFSISLIYSNLNFVKLIFDVVYLGNQHLKYLFEWDDREMSGTALIAWIIFWFFFKIWMAPLLLLLPFIFYWTKYIDDNRLVPVYQQSEDDDDEAVDTLKNDKTIFTRLQGLQDLTLTIKNGVDYIVSLLERIHNLVNFSVPYLSYLAMLALFAASVALYLIPANYLLIALGIYKFSRKMINPKRVPNNDILDFLSRVPDNRTLKHWQELKVPDNENHNSILIRK